MLAAILVKKSNFPKDRNQLSLSCVEGTQTSVIYIKQITLINPMKMFHCKEY